MLNMEYLQLDFSSGQQAQISLLICLHSWKFDLLHHTHLFHFTEAFSLVIHKATFYQCNLQPQSLEKCIHSPENLHQSTEQQL